MREVHEAAAEPDERDSGEEPGEDVYWRTNRLRDVVSDHLIESATAGDLYSVTAVLTDMWELDFEGRGTAAALMRDATNELLAVRDEDGLDAYVVRWKERLGIREPRSGGLTRITRWIRGHV